ncbi:MAG TPA: choice-of-anchor tandem repeat GloVer-containing protein [Terriglobales bacterium]|jgi:uncharacterized repeat protein (TIGR03803 family)|nr:choice-of-anchor tandem repeat GloVer-containing protein [Terriglobales bacterium]
MLSALCGRSLHRLWSRRWLAVVLLSSSVLTSASAQTIDALVNFNGSNGANPAGALVQGLDGNFYGVTLMGGATNAGTIFRVTPAGVLTTLVSFRSDAKDKEPYAGLLLGADGSFYGTTSNYNASGGCGNAFKMTSDGVVTVLVEFGGSKGCIPLVPFIQGPGGKLFGGTGLGDPNGNGNLFSLTTAGSFRNFLNFSFTNGSGPIQLLYASDGNIYGLTTEGGTGGCLFRCGTVFRLTPGGLTKLVDFLEHNGEFPIALLQALDGNFYGATMLGGLANCNDSPGCGTLFAGTLQGHFRTLANLDDPIGDGVTALLQASDGNLYGATAFGGSSTNCSIGCGAIFQSTLQGQLTRQASFDSGDANFGQWRVTLTQGTDGSFYGTTYYGGSSNMGSVFKLDLGLPAFVIASPSFASIGSQLNILGTNLLGTSAVSFNGAPATFTVVSATQIIATVPSGASSGQISVTTPTGVLKSNSNFRVIP